MRMNMGVRNQTAIRLTAAWVVLACVLVVGVILYWPKNHVTGGPGISSGIEHNLRLIDSAKEEWGIEHGANGLSVATKEDLAPYLKRYVASNGWLSSVAGEVYILGPLSKAPEAQLTREVDGRPKGTIIRFGTNGLLEFVLTNNPK